MSLTQLDVVAIRRSFERAAATYDQHAVLQREVESRLLERVEFHRYPPGLILDLGCGTGSASHALAAQFQAADVIALDWSPAMLSQVKRGASGKAGANPWRLCADMHALPLATRSVDLVFSNLALQWSYNLPDVLLEFRRIMKPGALLVFTCFGPDTLYELKQAWRAVDDLPHVNDHPDMHAIGDEMLAAGFQEPVMDVERLTLQYQQVMALLRELKGIGAHNVASRRAQGLTGRASMQAMLQAYEQFRHNDCYPASYEIIYGTAFAPQPGQPLRTPSGDIVTFSIDEMRSRAARPAKDST